MVGVMCRVQLRDGRMRWSLEHERSVVGVMCKVQLRDENMRWSFEHSEICGWRNV